MKKVLGVVIVAFWVFFSCKAVQVKEEEEILAADEHLPLVKGHCTGCHSAKLITMNRFTREGWQEKIRWMQKTQKLWDLGDAEPLVLDYLAKYYAPEPSIGRRENLKNIEWYKLEKE